MISGMNLVGWSARLQNGTDNSRHVSVEPSIGEADDTYPFVLPEPASAAAVGYPAFLREVSCPVKFDSEACLRDVEVHNEVSDGELELARQAMSRQDTFEYSQQGQFGRRWLVAQLLRPLQHLWVWLANRLELDWGEPFDEFTLLAHLRLLLWLMARLVVKRHPAVTLYVFHMRSKAHLRFRWPFSDRRVGLGHLTRSARWFAFQLTRYCVFAVSGIASEEGRVEPEPTRQSQPCLFVKSSVAHLSSLWYAETAEPTLSAPVFCPSLASFAGGFRRLEGAR